MTDREQQVLNTIRKAGGTASASTIGRETGISSDYAEQLCRDLVWQGRVIARGRRFVVKRN